MNAYKWSTTAASNNAAVPDGAPDGWIGSNVNEWGREVMARVREALSDAAYIDETYQLTTVGTKALARNSTTQFQINSCNATAHFTAGRRIRIVGGSTTDHGFVTSSSFSTNTLVNVTMDSGDVPASPTQALVHVDSKIRGAAYYKTGTGNGLDADTVDGYHVADVMGTSIFSDAIMNGSMMVWQRGTTGSCPASTRTFHADRWWTNPSGAAVTCDRTTSTPTGAISKYAKKITGATSVTTCDIAGQRIESNLIPYIKTTVNISALVKNETGAGLDLVLVLNTPSAEDNFTTVALRGSSSLTSITSGASARVNATFNVSAYTNIDNGLEIIFRSPSGSLDSGAKSITITEIQVDRATQFSYFRFRPIQDEIVRCQRYYRKTFAYETAPAQNWAGGGSGIPAGAIAIPGSSFATGPNAAVTWMFSVPMRATPTVVTYNPRASNAEARSINDTASQALTVTSSTSCVNFEMTASTAGSLNDRPWCFGATADAEL